jgi:hypothetical protein
MVDSELHGCHYGFMGMEQNCWGIKLLAKRSRRQLQVHAAAESTYRARRAAQQRAGHDLVDWVLEMSRKDSVRRSHLLHTPSVV